MSSKLSKEKKWINGEHFHKFYLIDDEKSFDITQNVIVMSTNFRKRLIMNEHLYILKS